MRIIKKLSEKINEELSDSEKYIKLAYKYQESYPDVADTFYKLSQEELSHSMQLHTQVVKIIDNFKKTKEVPTDMQAVYNYIHNEQIKRTRKLKLKIENFKS